MEKLEKKLTLNKETIEASNLCDRFSKDDLGKIGEEVYTGYMRDEGSRAKWMRRTQAAMDLAMQVQKEKSFPWAGASNVAFPLITMAALQFHSRAYPALISGTDVVKCRTIGEDPTGEKTKRAERISTGMSWQVLEEDKAWEEQHDKLLINLPIVGTTFVKSYYNADRGHNVSETVLAQDFVIDYWAKSLETAPRKTHIIPFFRNQLHTNFKRKIFRDVSNEAWYGMPPGYSQAGDKASAQRDNREGISPAEGDDTTPYKCLEQHVDMDLDQDGYAEPYIITVESTSKCVLRIVCGFDRPEDVQRTVTGDVISISRTEYFTKYEFIPSPDGGIYGKGFGVLLGPLNESVNSLINQLIDAGTMSNTAGGFLARGAKIRGGVYTFAPFQWQRVDSTGDDLTKSIVPLQVREPSTVLFQLLSLLINYVERLSGTTDPMVGESTGQNTPAETSRLMVQEGQRVYSSVFKRVWRSMKEEFKKLYVLNAVYLPERLKLSSGILLREDYLGNPDEVCPAADPNITSEQAAIQQAMTLKQAAATTPGYDPEAVERRFLKALKVDNIDEVYPGIAKTGQPKDVKLQIAEMKHESDMAWLQAEQQNFVIKMQEEVRVNSAEIMRIQAEIAMTIQDTEGDAQDRQVAMMQSILKSLEGRNSLMLKQIDVVIKRMELQRESIKANAGNAGELEKSPSNGNSAASSGGKAKAAA